MFQLNNEKTSFRLASSYIFSSDGILLGRLNFKSEFEDHNDNFGDSGIDNLYLNKLFSYFGNVLYSKIFYYSVPNGVIKKKLHHAFIIFEEIESIIKLFKFKYTYDESIFKPRRMDSSNNTTKLSRLTKIAHLSSKRRFEDSNIDCNPVKIFKKSNSMFHVKNHSDNYLDTSCYSEILTKSKKKNRHHKKGISKTLRLAIELVKQINIYTKSQWFSKGITENSINQYRHHFENLNNYSYFTLFFTFNKNEIQIKLSNKLKDRLKEFNLKHTVNYINKIPNRSNETQNNKPVINKGNVDLNQLCSKFPHFLDYDGYIIFYSLDDFKKILTFQKYFQDIVTFYDFHEKV